MLRLSDDGWVIPIQKNLIKIWESDHLDHLLIRFFLICSAAILSERKKNKIKWMEGLVTNQPVVIDNVRGLCTHHFSLFFNASDIRVLALLKPGLLVMSNQNVPFPHSTYPF